MIIPVSSHLMPIIQEALAIAYQTVEDEESAEIFKEVMWQLERCEVSSDGSTAVKVVSGEKGTWKLH